LREYVVIRIAHKGKFTSETLFRINLHFSSLIGKPILNGDKLTFKANLLKVGKLPLPSISGIFSFQNLPRFSQMIASGPNITPIHNGRSISNGISVLPDLFLPNCNISVNTDKKNSRTPTINVTTLEDLRFLSKSLGSSNNDEDQVEHKQLLK